MLVPLWPEGDATDECVYRFQVTIETFPGTGHGITVRARARPPPRPVAWARMSQTLHRPLASEELVQRSVEEGRAVQGYSSALRAMAAEVEMHDQPHFAVRVNPCALVTYAVHDLGNARDGLHCVMPQAKEETARIALENQPDPDAVPEPYTGTSAPAPPIQIQVGKKILTADHHVIVGTAFEGNESNEGSP